MANPTSATESLSTSGIGFALSSYVLWGLAPVYWKIVRAIPANEILIPRVLWTAILLLVLARLAGRNAETWDTDRRGWAWSAVAAVMLACNWGFFIYSVQSDQVLATSLGYYIYPLASIVLGLVVLGERLNRIQTIAVGIASVGVATLTLQAGRLPWISLILAGSFACYGLIHKLAPRPALAGLTREMLVLSPMAIVYVLWLFAHPGAEHGLLDASLGTHGVLALAGAVTAAPAAPFSRRHTAAPADRGRNVPVRRADDLAGPRGRPLQGVIHGDPRDGIRMRLDRARDLHARLRTTSESARPDFLRGPSELPVRRKNR